jgi:hypothetical protein
MGSYPPINVFQQGDDLAFEARYLATDNHAIEHLIGSSFPSIMQRTRETFLEEVQVERPLPPNPRFAQGFGCSALAAAAFSNLYLKRTTDVSYRPYPLKEIL